MKTKIGAGVARGETLAAWGYIDRRRHCLRCGFRRPVLGAIGLLCSADRFCGFDEFGT